MKKVLSLVLCCLMLFSAIPASADAIWDAIMNIPRNEAPDVYLNSVELSFDGDAYPQNVNGRVLVPFRAIAESYDATVGYDDTTGTITATRGDTTITFRNGDYAMTVVRGGASETVTMDVCPTLNTEFNRTMVPVRFLSEAFGLSVGWTGEDVIVADFRGLLEEVVEHNALLRAIREKRTDNPTPFILERKGERVMVADSFSEKYEESLTWNGVAHIDQNGYAYAGAHEKKEISNGNETVENTLVSEIGIGGKVYTKKGVYAEEGDYTETDLSYTSGEEFFLEVILHVLLSAKTFDACMEDALSMLENAHQSENDYAVIKNGLLAASYIFTQDSIVEKPGILDFHVSPEEYRRRALDFYKESGMSEEQLEEAREIIDSIEKTISLQITFSTGGDVVALVTEGSTRIVLEDMILEETEKETCTRIPGTPGEVVAPTNIVK